MSLDTNFSSFHNKNLQRAFFVFENSFVVADLRYLIVSITLQISCLIERC